MKIDEVIYKFQLEYDKIATNKRPNLSIPQILIWLNEAQRRVVNKKYSNYNIRIGGFEQKQKRIRELENLVPPTETLTATSIDSKTYSVDLNSLSNKLLYIIRSQSNATKGTCKDLIDNYEAPHNDLNNILRDDNFDPCFEWRETPVSYKSGQMYVYSDGTFTIDTVRIDYIRQPVDLDKAGYTKFDGTPSTDVQPELPDYVNDEIITEAVILASNPIERVQEIQLQQQKQITSE